MLEGAAMKVETKNLVSMTDANQNFSRVARMVDEEGPVVILRNSRPKYIVIEYDSVRGDEIADETSLRAVSRRIMDQRAEAYTQLAQ